LSTTVVGSTGCDVIDELGLKFLSALEIVSTSRQRDERKENVTRENNFILFTLLPSRRIEMISVCGLDFIFISADKDKKRNVNKKKMHL